ncbi:MAG: hypothetical protein AAFP90_23430, partial [Planctomycetota bacterium]
PRPSNPAVVLCSREFQELMEWFRQSYDYVILDSAPCLAVTDPASIAPLVDGVLVTFRLRRNVRSSAQQTIQSLRSVDANILGVVLNSVGDAYGGGAGHYRYTDAYGYGYGYGYGEGESRQDDYYRHDNTEQNLPVTAGRFSPRR